MANVDSTLEVLLKSAFELGLNRGAFGEGSNTLVTPEEVKENWDEVLPKFVEHAPLLERVTLVRDSFLTEAHDLLALASAETVSWSRRRGQWFTALAEHKKKEDA